MDIQKLIIDPIKKRIWEAAKNDLPIVQAAMQKAGTNDNSEKYWKKVLRIVKPVKRTEPVQAEHMERLRAAKLAYETREFPNWVKDGHFLEPVVKDINTANGLTNFILNFLNWSGHRGTRISSAGRQLPGGRFIPSTTRKGSADISSTINGKSVMWEVKINTDRPSPAQLKEQAKERKAGGEYFFVKNPTDFFTYYDQLSYKGTIFDR